MVCANFVLEMCQDCAKTSPHRHRVMQIPHHFAWEKPPLFRHSSCTPVDVRHCEIR